MVRVSLVLAALVSITGCSSSGGGTGGSSSASTSASGSGGAGGGAAVCAPGRQLACACEDGSSGRQTCLQDGSGFGVCRCDGAGGNGAGGGVGGAGSGGGGGAPPVCPAPSCPAPGDADLVINCDPACGPVDVKCSMACSLGGIPLGPDTKTLVRAPPSDGSGCGCATTMTWGLHFGVPAGQSVQIIGPPGVMIATTDGAVDVCSDQTTICTNGTAGGTAQVVIIGLVSSMPSANGGLFKIWTHSTPHQPIDCSTAGCNGDGG